MTTFKPQGRKDYMGFRWFAVYIDDTPYKQQGQHVKYKALDADHARRIHNQILDAANRSANSTR